MRDVNTAVDGLMARFDASQADTGYPRLVMTEKLRNRTSPERDLFVREAEPMMALSSSATVVAHGLSAFDNRPTASVAMGAVAGTVHALHDLLVGEDTTLTDEGYLLGVSLKLKSVLEGLSPRAAEVAGQQIVSVAREVAGSQQASDDQDFQDFVAAVCDLREVFDPRCDMRCFDMDTVRRAAASRRSTALAPQRQLCERVVAVRDALVRPERPPSTSGPRPMVRRQWGWGREAQGA